MFEAALGEEIGSSVGINDVHVTDGQCTETVEQ